MQMPESGHRGGFVRDRWKGRGTGADAALEKAKATKDAARKAAQEDRDRNLGERGEDANESEAVIAEIRRSEG